MNQCFIGDCRESMRLMLALDMRVQMCVTSPPYYGLRDYGHAGQLGLEETPDQYVTNLIEVFRLVHDLLADDGTLWLNLGDSYATAGGSGKQGKSGQRANRRHTAEIAANKGVGNRIKPKDLLGIPWRVAFALQSDGWYLRQDIIWHKPNPMPESVTDRCTKAHEYLFMLSKSPRYYFDSEAIKGPCDPKNHRDSPTRRRNPPPGQSTDSGFVNGRRYETRNRRSVWTISTKPYKGAHFATFPPDLVEPCILAGSRPGDTVFDPFFGSGTTGAVAQKHGRQWIGCEINSEYKTLQDERIK